MACGRRGSTPIPVLIMTLSLATPASSAIHMTGNSGLLSWYHDKERDLIFALERARPWRVTPEARHVALGLVRQLHPAPHQPAGVHV